MLAVAPLAVRDAHYVKHDVPVTLLVVLTHARAGAPALERRSATPHALALDHRRRCSPGLAMSTHYYAIFLALPIAARCAVTAEPAEPRGRESRARRLAVAGRRRRASPFFAALAVPARRTAHARCATSSANRQIVMDRATDGGGLFGSLGFYLRCWLDAMAMRPVLAIVGARRRPASRPRCAMGVAVSADRFPSPSCSSSRNTFPASRYLNPLLPFVAVLAG